MATRNSRAELQAMLRDPAGVFRSPRVVLDHPDLTPSRAGATAESSATKDILVGHTRLAHLPIRCPALD
jgi:hypothetical protein